MKATLHGSDREEVRGYFLQTPGPGRVAQHRRMLGRRNTREARKDYMNGSRKFPGQLTDKPDSVGLCMLISLPRAALIISAVAAV